MYKPWIAVWILISLWIKEKLKRATEVGGSTWPLAQNTTTGLFYRIPSTAGCVIPLRYYSALFATRQSDVSRLPPHTSHSLTDSFAVRIWNMAVACGPYITRRPPAPTFALWKKGSLTLCWLKLYDLHLAAKLKSFPSLVNWQQHVPNAALLFFLSAGLGFNLVIKIDFPSFNLSFVLSKQLRSRMLKCTTCTWTMSAVCYSQTT